MTDIQKDENFGYQLGTIGHSLMGGIDNLLYGKMDESAKSIDEISAILHRMNRLIAEFERLRGNDRETPVDISELEDMIQELQDKFYEEFPSMGAEDRLIPKGLDLSKVDQSQLDRIIGHVESIKMRYQNKIPVIMEKLNTQSTLYRILSEICSEMAKITREEKTHSVRRQVG
ncbi:MAG: hypothetical protein Tsb0015_11320 [Simkaniaceae bacterium]